MKHTLKILLFTIFVTLIALALTSVSAFAAPEKVVYISADGTGDGSSPDKPLGNSAGYKPGNKMETHNAFYLGLNKLKDTGGTLVIVGDVSLDSVESRFPSTPNEILAPSEFRAPNFVSNTKLTVTSVYDGVDYRTKGAELILDHDVCNTTAFAFSCNTTLKDIDILYKYHSDHPNSWNTSFMLCGGGYDFTIDNGVKVSSLDTKTNTAGDRYPILVGGHRYATIKRSYTTTVKSGTWDTLIGGSFGIVKLTQYAKVEGNVGLKIEGGKIENVIGTGSLQYPINSITGTLSISVTGGEIGELYLSHAISFPGSKIEAVIAKEAKISKIYYAPDNYQGNIDTLVKKTTLNNQSAAEIIKTAPAPIETTPPATQPPATQPPVTQPTATQPAEVTESETIAETPEETTEETISESVPETTASAQNQSEEDLSEDLKNIFTVVLIIGIVIGVGSFVLDIIKTKMLK